MKNVKKLTLKDVARQLDVSTATISNAFNRPDQLSTSLRESILARCEEIGYYGPNAAARSLRTGRTGIVGVVLSDELSYSLHDPVANQFITGMAEVFEENDYNMLLLSARESGMDVQNRMQSSMVDGFIVYGHKPQQCRNAPWLDSRKNVVAVDSVIEGMPSVNVTNEQGAYEVARHALCHQPKHVAIMGLALLAGTDRVCRMPDDESYEGAASISIERLAGYRKALSEEGIEVAPELIWNIPHNDHKLAYQAAREALTMANRPQLLLCMSDRIALAALQAALQMGIRVPEELQVVGFDGISESETFHPSITTVHQQSVLKGQIAAEIFLGLRESKSVELGTELVIRESCPKL